MVDRLDNDMEDIAAMAEAVMSQHAARTHVIDPKKYDRFMEVMSEATLIIDDSGPQRLHVLAFPELTAARDAMDFMQRNGTAMMNEATRPVLHPAMARNSDVPVIIVSGTVAEEIMELNAASERKIPVAHARGPQSFARIIESVEAKRPKEAMIGY